tara:strand:- start:488 stop:742 length:255 start_codon:yes stop_codon:yes gene_type:complete
MKITKQRLREIIKEELSGAPDDPVTEIFGGSGAAPWDGDFAAEQHKAVLDMMQILKVRLARVEKELGKTWDAGAAEAHAVDLEE